MQCNTLVRQMVVITGYYIVITLDKHWATVYNLHLSTPFVFLLIRPFHLACLTSMG